MNYYFAVKRIPNALQKVLYEAVKSVNFIKSRPLNPRIISAVYDEIGIGYTMLLLRTSQV
jgi:hypothetical protein